MRSCKDPKLTRRFQLAKTSELLSKMALIFAVDPKSVPEYVRYFDITHFPSTVFFYNAQHLKCEFGSVSSPVSQHQPRAHPLSVSASISTPDHTKWVGAFADKQDFIDLIEVMFRGAIHGKSMTTSPIPRERVPRFEIIFKDI